MNLKKLSSILFLSLSFLSCSSVTANDVKQEAVALYATKNYSQAYKLLDSIQPNQKDEETFLLMANIAQEDNKDNLAIQNLNKAIDKNASYYKAYYNLGCIFAKKKSYIFAINNFENAIKYNKNFAPAYYNLACCEMKLRNFESAKKNLIKAVSLEANNKDYLYNLAYCYKELNQEKQAKKILEEYNKLQ